MISADQEFRDVANRAAAAYQARPAYVSYRTHVRIEVPSLRRSRDIERAIEVRTQDDVAVIQDLPRGQRQISHAYPINPTFDAISYFSLSWKAGPHDRLEAYVSDVRPLTFTTPQSNANVVVTSLRYYHAEFAADSRSDEGGKMHIVLNPLQTLTQFHNGNLYLRDVYIDNADKQRLPSRVTWVSPAPDSGEFTVDYRRDGDRWMVDHAFFTQSIPTPLRLARFRINADARFESFTFESQPASKELLLPR